MDSCADAADPLRERPGIARVAALQNELDAAEHRRRRPRVADGAAVDLRLDPEVPFDARDRIDDDAAHSGSPFCSGDGRLRLRRDRLDSVADALGNLDEAVPGKRRTYAEGCVEANLVHVGSDAEPRHASEVLVERRHAIPEIGLGAADARVAAADRPVGAFVPPHVRAVLERHRPLAPHLVEAVAGAMAFVAPRLDVLPGVVVRAALAVVVDRLAVRKEGSAEVVERRPPLEREVVDQQRRQVLDVGRARRQVDQVPDAGDGVGDAKGTSRVRGRGRDAAESGARTDRDRRRGAAADLTSDVYRRATADRAVSAISACRNRTLDDRDVGARALFDGRGEVLFGLVPCRSHDRLVIVHRQHVENNLRGARATGPKEALGVACTVLELEPDQHGFVRLTDRLRDLGRHCVRQRQRCRHRRAEPHELASRDPAPRELGCQPSAPVAHRSPVPCGPLVFFVDVMRAQSAPTNGMRRDNAGRIDGAAASSS